MASVSVSHMIIFIASLLVAASVAGTLTTGVDRLAGAVDEESLRMSQQVRTDLAVISDPEAGVYNTSGESNVTLLVKNVGSRDLPADGTDLDVLIDGRYQTNVTITVVDGEFWDPGNVARVEIDPGSLAAGDHRVRIVATGDEEVFEFRV